MTVAQMMATMSAVEFESWKVIYRIDPFGNLREDMRAGMMVSPIINHMRAYLMKQPKYVKAGDWILDLTKEPEAESPQSMKSKLDTLANKMRAEEALKKNRGK